MNQNLSSLATSEVDGIRVQHLPSDDEVSRVVLLFGVGMRDENLAEQGVLHALEHVVMHSLRHTPLDINASVDASHTEFTAIGSPVLVGEHLERLCRALTAPPVERLADEASVLAAELSEATLAEPLHVARYGLRDLGSQSVPGPGPDGLSAEQLQAAAARWFVRGNASLLVDGPIPALSLPLPPGDRPVHRRVEPRRLPGPHAIRLDGPACGLSLLLPAPDADCLDLLAAQLVETRVAEAVRHRGGHSYAIDISVHPSGAHGQDLLLSAEPPEERAVEAARTLVSETLDLLRAGPTTDEVLLAVATLRERWRGREAALEKARIAALDELLDLPSRELDVARLEQVELDTVARYLRSLVPDLLVAVPDDPELVLEPLGVATAEVVPSAGTELPEGERFRPPLLARALSGAARQAVLVRNDQGLHVRLERETHALRWEDVVGVLVEDEHEAALFGADGTVVEVGSVIWRGGDRLLAEVRDRVPAPLVYQRSALLGRDED